MEQTGPIARARGDFQTFVHGFDTYQLANSDVPEDERTIRYLGFFLRSWLEEGHGLRMTGGNYESYLRVSLDIADAVMQGNIDFNYNGSSEREPYERQIDGIHNPGDEHVAEYADRMLYEQLAHDRRLLRWY